MRIAELSRDSGVSVPTIKYYVREGLLKPGELTSPNQAQYDDSHLRRLRLIRALTEVGGLSVAAVRELLDAASAPATSLHDALGKVQYATTASHQYEAAQEAAHQQVDDFIRRHGWEVRPDSPARRVLASVLTELHDLGQDDLVSLADAYAAPAEQIAAADVTAILARQGRDSQLQGVVIGTVLGDTMLSALRRLAQENASAGSARLPATAAASTHDTDRPRTGDLRPGGSPHQGRPGRVGGCHPGPLSTKAVDARAAGGCSGGRHRSTGEQGGGDHRRADEEADDQLEAVAVGGYRVAVAEASQDGYQPGDAEHRPDLSAHVEHTAAGAEAGRRQCGAPSPDQ
jgi:DNA-binding transcriptional MerR regulator